MLEFERLLIVIATEWQYFFLSHSTYWPLILSGKVLCFDIGKMIILMPITHPSFHQININV